MTVVLRCPLPDGVFPPCDHGLFFYITISLLCENVINQSIKLYLRAQYLLKFCLLGSTYCM